MRPPGSPEALERRRLKAAALFKKGFAPVEIARMLGVVRRSVRRWRASLEAKGTAGLAASPAPGRPPKLSPREQRRLQRLLLRGPQAAGYPTELWTGARVANLIRREFGVRYHPNHMGRLLRSLGFSPQKPERRARERDEEAIRRWVKTQWARVKKTPRA